MKYIFVLTFCFVAVQALLSQEADGEKNLERKFDALVSVAFNKTLGGSADTSQSLPTAALNNGLVNILAGDNRIEPAGSDAIFGNKNIESVANGVVVQLFESLSNGDYNKSEIGTISSKQNPEGAIVTALQSLLSGGKNKNSVKEKEERKIKATCKTSASN